MRALTLLSLMLLTLSGAAFAQDPPPLKPEELDALTAPVALYPDSLLAQLLMATTYPADVALAAEWSAAHKDNTGDDAIKMVEGEPWDPSVKSLVAFPQILAMMKEQPDWVQQMGDAFLAQSKDVMDSVQRLRKQAKDAGNLKSTEEQVVKEEPAPATADATTTTSTSTETTIIIEPADPQVVYVPNYDTTVVYGSWGYPAYPPTYFPPPPGYYWGSAVAAGLGFAAGVAIIDGIWGDCNWGGGDIDIDIDRYNNINVGNELNIGSGNNKWEHNSANRDGVPYRDSGSREKYSKENLGADQRSDYRGRDTAGATSASTRDGSAAATRDAQREAARGNLERSTGVNTRDASGAAGQINRDLANQGVSAGDLARDSSRDLSGGATAGTRDLSGAGGARDASGGNRSAATAGTRDASGANRASAGTSSRDYSGSASRTSGGSSYSGGSRDSAFSGASSPSASRQSVSRGTSSAGGRSMSSGGARAGGGGGGRRR